MTTVIDTRMAESQHAVAVLRTELASVDSALDQAQQLLHDGDRLLAQVESGLIIADSAVKAGRRAMPALLVVAGISGAIAVVIVVRKRKRQKAVAPPQTPPESDSGSNAAPRQ